MVAAGDGRWHLAVDTGGTFTDCLAVDPAGRLRRAKVLSSAALRTRIAARLGDGAVRLGPIGSGGGRLPAGFFDGCELRLLGPAAGVGAGWRVLASGAEGGGEAGAEGGREGGGDAGAEGGGDGGAELRLDGTLPAGELAGAPVELRAVEEAPVLAARLLTGTPPGRPLPPLTMRLATTRGTNALLERTGAAVALFVTRGFADLLRIGTQQRPDLFALAIARPAPLYRAVVEVDERLAADGSTILPLDLAALRGRAGELLAAGVRCAAVALLHSYRNPRHEQEIGAFLRGLGFEHVALSAALAPLIKLLPRAETAVVDAYLAPVLAGYLAAVAGALPSGALHVMTSAGGLVQAAAFRAKDSLLSGPAGGVVGAARAGRASGFSRVIAFDMGGTSTDVARFDGDFEYLFEHRVGDAHLVAPALAIESVAAGGGSICAYRDGRLRVGPESAGARPGPACYGAGGPLTLTDVNLLLGRLAPGRFEIPLDPGAAERAAAELLGPSVPAAGEQGRAAARAGETGREGAAGEPGRDGAAAEPGREGAAGEAGREGAAAEGTAGEPGREGAAGEGTAGEPGREGTAGEPGREGEAGRDGAAGGEVVLAGLLAIADERMAEAIRGISLRRGYDPAEYALVAFGGAGPQHACAVAALLGMDTVLVPADASLLSALGLGAAVVERFAQRQVLAPLAEVAGRLDGWCEELGREAAAAVAAEGVPLAAIEVRRRIVALRFAGQESTLTVDYHGAAGLAAAFAAAYREVYGYDLNEAAAGAAEAPVAAAPQTGQRRGPAPAAAVGVDEARDDRGEPRPPAGPQGRAIEVESLRVVASSGSAAAGGEEEGPKRPGSGDGGAAGLQVGAGSGGGARVAAGEGAEARRAFMAGAWRQVPAYERGALAPGAAFEGPALVLEDHTATVVAAGWSCRLDRAGALVLRRQRSGIAGQDDGRAARRDGEGQG